MRTVTLYQLYDLVARTTAGPIMAYKHDGAALRAFGDTLAAEGILPNKYPEQFNLLKLGEQDEDTGAIFIHIQNESAQGEIQTLATGRGWKQGGSAQLELEQP